MCDAAILTINAGSSSIKFSVYGANDLIERITGQVDSLAPDRQTTLTIKAQDGERQISNITASNHHEALGEIMARSDQLFAGSQIVGAGHRIVHGGTKFDAPARLTTETMAELATFEPLAPLHQPHNLDAARATAKAFPQALQIGCFDTAFHRAHPWVNDTFALPRKWYDEGVRRYGFHGISYDYITSQLAATDPELYQGRVIICHLGNGASMCAVKNGKSVGSTMGFSPLDGLPMGTRCGQLDPGVLLFMMDQKGMTSQQISNLLYKESGLKGLSGISNDMRDLEASDDPAAAEAIDYFVFRIRREIGGMTAVLGGLDALVFCGGIGENSSKIRSRVCDDMDWLGLAIDGEANRNHHREISTGATKVAVLVIPTDEEIVIARAVKAALDALNPQ